MGTVLRLTLAIVVLVASLASAQSSPFVVGSVAGVDEAVTLTPTDVGTGSVQISGVWTGTLTFETTTDGTNYQPWTVTVNGAVTTVTTTTGDGIWLGGMAGFRSVRVRASAWTSGSATVTIRSSRGSQLAGTLGVSFAGSIPVTQATSPWVVSFNGGSQPVTQGTSPWIVDGSGVVQPVSGPLTDAQLRASPVPISGSVTASGTVTANQGTSPWVVGGTVASTQGTSPWISAETDATASAALTTTTCPGTGCVEIATAGKASVGFQVDGTACTASWIAEGLLGTEWITIAGVNAQDESQLVSTGSCGGVDYFRASSAGYEKVRLRLFSVTSGTVTVALRASARPAGVTTGYVTGTVSANSFTLDGAGNPIESAINDPVGTERGLIVRNIPSGTQPVSGTFFQATQPISAAALPLPTGAATEVSLANVVTQTGQLVSFAGDPIGATGAGVLGAATSAQPVHSDNTMHFLSVDLGGSLRVGVTGGFIAATQQGTWSTRTQDGAGNAIASATTTPGGADRGLVVRNIPSGTQAVSGTVTATPTGTQDVNLLNLAGSAIAANNGAVSAQTQRVTIANDSTGVLANVATIGTSVTPGTGATNLGKAEDAAATSADVGVASLLVRRDAAAVLTSAADEYVNPAADGYGMTFVRQDHVNRIRCTITSTATSSTVVTGCAAPGASLSIYITGLNWSSSIISTTANFMRIQSGTGGTCGTGTTVLYDGFVPTAFGNQSVTFPTPIKVAANSEVCFVHASAGTRLVNIVGFIAQ